MNRYAKIYAWALLCLLVAAEIALIIVNVNDGKALLYVALGFVCAYFFAAFFHEWGHALFARSYDMKVVGIKICFLSFEKMGKRWRFRFVNPFFPDHTDVLPKCGGDMKMRACMYALGGLIGGGILAFVLLVATVSFLCAGVESDLTLAMLPYCIYLFALNVAPFEYATGKTDMLVYLGIRRGEDSEAAMINSMEIYGQLFEGKRYAEIDEKFYFDIPQLMEDDPMFSMNLFLRYRFYLDKNQLEKAGEMLNRLATSAEYLSQKEETELAVELTYMHSLNGDKAAADECAELCKPYLSMRSVTALRVLAAYSAAFGEWDKTDVLLSSAKKALADEPILGVQRAEEALVERIFKQKA